MRVLVNGDSLEVSSDATVADAVATLPGAREGRGVAAALDGEVVPRDQWARTKLVEGARVELVVAVQGG